MNNNIPIKVFEAIEHLCGEIEAQLGGAEEDSDFDTLNTKRIKLVRSWLYTDHSSVKTCLNCNMLGDDDEKLADEIEAGVKAIVLYGIISDKNEVYIKGTVKVEGVSYNIRLLCDIDNSDLH